MDTVLDADRVFAFLIGLPDDPDALALGQRLRQINLLDDITRYRIKREIAGFLDEVLVEATTWAA